MIEAVLSEKYGYIEGTVLCFYVGEVSWSKTRCVFRKEQDGDDLDDDDDDDDEDDDEDEDSDDLDDDDDDEDEYFCSRAGLV